MGASGKQVATTKTDAAGEYYFGGVGAAYELTPGAKYTVQFDVCTANTSKVPSQPPATELRFTLPLAGNDRAHDSNVIPPTTGQLCNGYAPVTEPANPGGVDHTIDAGVYIPQAPPTSTPPASTPPTTPMPTNPPPSNTRPGSLASTGISSLPAMIFLGVVLLGAGAAFVFVSRKRRAKQR
ncbi:LPXTG cell wall anchor domain-containing protein [Saccharopolyspora sp. 5N102]|uniref:LPXTG cell wall anchor domain-containing protein n=1 Tax=Saccharopolyspora sp. 5N102 TaxID=3375155 RepID=UPI00378F242D